MHSMQDVDVDISINLDIRIFDICGIVARIFVSISFLKFQIQHITSSVKLIAFYHYNNQSKSKIQDRYISLFDYFLTLL